LPADNGETINEVISGRAHAVIAASICALAFAKDPVILERLDKQGIEPAFMNNTDFARLLAQDYERMAKVVKASGAKVE
jgi:hypothetical protein